jgi:hypothetical protein
VTKTNRLSFLQWNVTVQVSGETQSIVLRDTASPFYMAVGANVAAESPIIAAEQPFEWNIYPAGPKLPGCYT